MRYFFGWNLSVHQYLLILLLLMILLNWVRNLKYLTPVSLFAAVANVTGLGITFFYMLRTSSYFHCEGVWYSEVAAALFWDCHICL
jgi:uncharacterized membrane protein YesL